MKKIIGVIFAVLLLTESQACDICGCGVGSNYIGILPEFSSHIFGLRYRYNRLRTHIGVGGMPTYLTTREIYRTAELWGGWNIGKKFRVMATIPVAFNERTNQDLSLHKNGLGDASVNGYYNLLNKKSAVGKGNLFIQSMWVGGGIKVPTGKYNPVDKATGQNTNLFQLGTASTDFMLNLMYDARLQDVGINIAAAYKVNSANKYDYTYGNKLSTSSQLYYKFRFNEWLMIAPNAGVMYEHSAKDDDQRFPVDISGGNILSATAGFELTVKKIFLGASIQQPVSQELANGIVKSGNRGMLHISFLL